MWILTQKAGVPLVLCTVEYNLLDFAPEGSVPRVASLSQAPPGHALRRFRTGRDYAAQGKFNLAEKELRAAIDLTDLPNRALSFINPEDPRGGQQAGGISGRRPGRHACGKPGPASGR